MLSKEWSDYHLTPSGWVEGKTQRDPGVMIERPIPPDRVLTCRYHDETPVVYERVEYTHETWRADDSVAIDLLFEKFGECPQLIAI